MKKMLSVLIALVFLSNIFIAVYTANAGILDDLGIDLSSLSSMLSTTQESNDITGVAIPSNGGTIAKTTNSSDNTVTLTANANDGYTFYGWITNASAILTTGEGDTETLYSTEETIAVSNDSEYRTFYALFVNDSVTSSTSESSSESQSSSDTSESSTQEQSSDETTQSTNISVPSDLSDITGIISSIMSTSETQESDTSSTTQYTGTVITTTESTEITADQSMVERASVAMSLIFGKLNPTEEQTTSTTTETTTAAATNKPKKTSIKKITAKSKAFKVTWKKISAAKGYQIKYSTSKNFTKKKTKTVTVKKSTTTSKTIKNLKANKKYYVKVRTYKVVNGKKIYSKWSSVKTVKTKK